MNSKIILMCHGNKPHFCAFILFIFEILIAHLKEVPFNLTTLKNCTKLSISNQTDKDLRTPGVCSRNNCSRNFVHTLEVYISKYMKPHKLAFLGTVSKIYLFNHCMLSVILLPIQVVFLNEF